VIQAYRLAAAALFVVIAIPFMVDQVRTAIYPALAFERTLEFPLGATLEGVGEENPASNTGTPQGVAEENAVSAPASPPPPVQQALERPGD